MQLAILALFLQAPLFSMAQAVLWERRITYRLDDELVSVIDLEDGTYLAAGTRNGTTSDGTQSGQPSITLVRFTAQGDTIYVQNSGQYGITPRMCRTAQGRVFVLGLTRDAIGFFHEMSLIGPDSGKAIWTRRLGGFGSAGPGISALIEGPHDNLIMIASGPDSLQLSSNIGYIARYDTAGNLIWTQTMREHPDYTLLNHVEMTGQGTILVSGTAGSRIWAAELDEDGRELRRATFYATPSRILFDESACVRQAPGGRYVVSGTTQASPSRYYLGMHQGWAGSAVYGGEEVAQILAPEVLDDGGVLSISYTGFGRPILLTRLGPDSGRVWQVSYQANLGQRSTIPRAYSYLEDSSAILVGSAIFPSPASQDFYLARITGVGLPYRPWVPTATRFLAHQPMPVAYPNPTTGSLRFTGLAAPATLHLYATDGRQVLGQSLQAGQAADLSALPPGLYQYRLTAKGKAWRGRVVKR